MVRYAVSVDTLHAITDPINYEIIKALIENGSGMFISDVSKKVGRDRMTVASHLMYLEDKRLVETYLRKTDKKEPILERFVAPTECLYKAGEILKLVTNANSS